MKDKNNLISYNDWTCGDYTGEYDLTTSANVTCKVSPEYSTIGEHSFHIINKNAYSNSQCRYSSMTAGKTYIITADIRVDKQSSFVLKERNSSGDATYSVNIPADDNWNTYVLTCTVRSGSTRLDWFVEPKVVGTNVFIDNMRLVESS